MTRPWTNKSGQLSFIENILLVPSSVFSFALNEEEEKDATTTDDVQNALCLNRKGWASSLVLQLLFEMSDDPNLAPRVGSLFSQGLSTYPEILLCSIVRFSTSKDTASHNLGLRIKKEIIRELIDLIFMPCSKVRNSLSAVQRLWVISQNDTLKFSIEAWRLSNTKENKIRFQILGHIIRILSNASPKTFQAKVLYGSGDYNFSIAVAFFMADHNALDLPLYLDDQVKKVELPFIMGLVAFIAHNVQHTSLEKGQSLISASNLIASLTYLLRGLDPKVLNKKIPTESGFDTNITIGESVKALLNQCYKMYPQLSDRLSAPSPTPNSSQKDDIEKDANMYFQQIYKGEIEIDDIIDMLKRFKTSGNSRENDIFACMIHNLFDEYRFFSKYPA
jgi:CCR4-NOT transcription complex subunit 1